MSPTPVRPGRVRQFRADLSRRPLWLRAVALAVLLLLVATPVAGAAVVLSDDTTTITAGQTVNEDAYIFGNEVNVNGTASFDVVAAANTFDIGETGSVGGNVNVAASEVRISGTVGRSVRVAAEQVTISGPVGGDVVVAARVVRVAADAQVSGDLRIAANTVTVLGTVSGDVIGSAGSLTIDGATIGGNVDVSAGDLDIVRDSQVGGAVRYESDAEATIGSQATITGPVERRDSSVVSSDGVSLTSGIVWDVARLLAMLVTGLVIVLVAPRTAAAVADGARTRFPRTVLAGVMALVLVPVLAVLLLITVIGIPAALFGLVAWLLAIYASQVVVGLALGRLILPRIWRSGGRGFNILAMALGVTLIGLVRLIPVPFVDPVVAVIVAVIGVGALFSAVRRDAAPAQPSPAYHGQWQG